eukprot:scaffold230010_cov56-Cyclotella_meneghiniana.AAC.4
MLSLFTGTVQSDRVWAKDPVKVEQIPIISSSRSYKRVLKLRTVCFLLHLFSLLPWPGGDAVG